MICQKLKLLLLIIFPISLFGQQVSYSFCVESEEFPVFKATVVYRAVDFGENAAKQMVAKRLNSHMNSNYSIEPFDQENCDCADDCPVLNVKSEDMSGGLKDMEAATFVGVAAESMDMLIFNAKSLFNDPGGFIKQTFFKKSGN